MHKSGLTFMLLGIIALMGLFLLLKPLATEHRVPAVAGKPAAEAAPAEAAAGPGQPSAVPIQIVGGKRVGGPEVIRLRQGEVLALSLTSDKNGELHLHGYDLRVQLQAGQPAELRFTAEHSGRFEYELHGHGQGAHAALGVIEVLPR